MTNLPLFSMLKRLSRPPGTPFVSQPQEALVSAILK
jgi:hypothetical protein